MPNRHHRVLRRRLDDAASSAEPGRRAPALGSPAMIGQIVDGGAKPKTVPGEFLIEPYTISFLEAEGFPVTLTKQPGTARVPVSVLHSAVPPTDAPMVARLNGGRWTTLYGRPAKPAGPPPCCQCIPKILTLDSDATPAELRDQRVPGYINDATYPVTFEWGPRPFTKAVIYASGAISADYEENAYAYGLFMYLEPPEYGWFSGPPITLTGKDLNGDTTTAQYIFWLWVNNCTVFIMPVFLGGATCTTIGIAGLPKESFTYDAQAIPESTIWTTMPKNGLCELDQESFSYTGTQRIENQVSWTTLSTQYLSLTTGANYYYPECIPLDDNNSAGAPQSRSVPGGGCGEVGGGFGGNFGGSPNSI